MVQVDLGLISGDHVDLDLNRPESGPYRLLTMLLCSLVPSLFPSKYGNAKPYTLVNHSVGPTLGRRWLSMAWVSPAVA